MIRRFRRRRQGFGIGACLALGVVLLPGWAAALTGTAASPADTLDSLPPVIAVASPAGGELFTGLIDEALLWSVSDGGIAAGREIALSVFDDGGEIWQDAEPFTVDGPYEFVWSVTDLNTETARFVVQVTDDYGWSTADTSAVFMIQSLTDVPGARITADGVDSVHPNPFNPSTRIEFSLRAPAAVELGVYDTRGRRVAVIARGALPQGRHVAVWSGRDDRGRLVPSGTYLARLSVRGDDRSSTHVERMTLVK